MRTERHIPAMESLTKPLPSHLGIANPHNPSAGQGLGWGG